MTDSEVDRLVEHRRMRCFGHVLNIIASSFIFEKSEGDRLKSIALSAVQKAHQLAVYIRWSPQRRNTFRKVVKKVQARVTTGEVTDFVGEADLDEGEEILVSSLADGPLPTKKVWDSDEETVEVQERDTVKVHNDTRWNSVLTEVDSCLRLKEAMNTFYYDQHTSPDAATRLSNHYEITVEDWACLEEIRQILQPFEETTLWHEGRNILLPDVMSSMQEIQDHLRKFLARYDLVEEESDVG